MEKDIKGQAKHTRHVDSIEKDTQARPEPGHVSEVPYL